IAKTRAFGSTANSMSRRIVSSFWNEQASAARPGKCSSTSSSTSWGVRASMSGGRGRLATEEHLLERVAAQPEPQGLERDHLVGRDVAEIDVRAEVLDEPGLALLRRRLPDQSFEGNSVLDLVHEPRPELTARPVDAGGAALPALGDAAPGPRVELL